MIPAVLTRTTAAALAAVLLFAACERPDEPREGDGGFLPGDTLSEVPEGPPVTAADSGAHDGPAEEAVGARETGGAGEAAVCPADAKSPERLDLRAEWEGAHVRVSGRAEGGAGNALSLALSQGERFVFDEIFRSDLLSVITLKSDSVDVSSVDYRPSRSEQAAFARTGAVPLDPARPVCLDVSLYEKGSLDLLAVRHLPVEGSAPLD